MGKNSERKSINSDGAFPSKLWFIIASAFSDESKGKKAFIEKINTLSCSMALNVWNVLIYFCTFAAVVLS